MMKNDQRIFLMGLTKVQIHKTQLSYLPRLNITSVKHLIIPYVSQLSNIQQIARSQLHQLTVFQIYRSKLKKLPQFKWRKIQKLDLWSNQISSIEEFALKTYPNLKKLNLNTNKIQRVPKLNCPVLEELSISSNQINNIEQFIIGTYESLTKLDIGNNLLQKIPNLDKVLPNIQRLVLSYTALKSLQEFATRTYPHLKQLFAQGNQLQTLPKFNTPSIQWFCFPNNKIEQIEIFASQQYPVLKKLDFNDNRISKIPFIKSESLESLYVNKNPLSLLQQFISTEIFFNLKQITLKSLKPVKFTKLPINLSIFHYEQSELDDQYVQGLINSCLNILLVYQTYLLKIIIQKSFLLSMIQLNLPNQMCCTIQLLQLNITQVSMDLQYHFNLLLLILINKANIDMNHCHYCILGQDEIIMEEDIDILRKKKKQIQRLKLIFVFQYLTIPSFSQFYQLIIIQKTFSKQI